MEKMRMEKKKTFSMMTKLKSLKKSSKKSLEILISLQ